MDDERKAFVESLINSFFVDPVLIASNIAIFIEENFERNRTGVLMYFKMILERYVDQESLEVLYQILMNRNKNMEMFKRFITLDQTETEIAKEVNYLLEAETNQLLAEEYEEKMACGGKL